MSAVACLGDCCLDVYVEPVARVLVGGSCLNVAVGLARHGVEAVYAGPIGDDDGGERVLALLAEHGLADDRVRRVPGARTAVTQILLEEAGERRFLHEDYAIQERFAPTAAEWQWIASARAVHSSRMPAHLARLRAIGAAGVRVSYDFTTDSVPARLSGLEVVFVPDEALAGQAPADAARMLVARGAACAVVTRGERGAVAATASAVETVDAVPVAPCGRHVRRRRCVRCGVPRPAACGRAAACVPESRRGDGAAACLHLGAIEQPGYPLEARA